MLLQLLEMGTLAATWITVWAGTVFNSNPYCEDEKGGTLGWCDGLSIFIGLMDVLMALAVVVVIAYYMKQEKCDACIGMYRCHVLKTNEAEWSQHMESAGVISCVNPVFAAKPTLVEMSIEMTESGSRSQARTESIEPTAGTGR